MTTIERVGRISIVIEGHPGPAHHRMTGSTVAVPHSVRELTRMRIGMTRLASRAQSIEQQFTWKIPLRRHLVALPAARFGMSPLQAVVGPLVIKVDDPPTLQTVTALTAICSHEAVERSFMAIAMALDAVRGIERVLCRDPFDPLPSRGPGNGGQSASLYGGKFPVAGIARHREMRTLQRVSPNLMVLHSERGRRKCLQTVARSTDPPVVSIRKLAKMLIRMAVSAGAKLSHPVRGAVRMTRAALSPPVSPFQVEPRLVMVEALSIDVAPSRLRVTLLTAGTQSALMGVLMAIRATGESNSFELELRPRSG